MEVAGAGEDFGLDTGVVRNDIRVSCAEYTTWEGSVGMKDARRFRIWFRANLVLCCQWDN